MNVGRTIRRTIRRQLKEYFERYYEIKILFAVENGSRAWNMHSKSSDLDVRFVYVYNDKDTYHDLFKKVKQTIECSFYITKGIKGTKNVTEEYKVEVVGWELGKFLKLLMKSNCTAMEWVTSDIVYLGKEFLDNKGLQFLVDESSLYSLFKHYISLAKSNYNKYIKNEEVIIVKKLLYVLRGIFMAAYIVKADDYKQLPFDDLLNFSLREKIINKEEYESVSFLLNMKREERERKEKIFRGHKHAKAAITLTEKFIADEYPYILYDDRMLGEKIESFKKTIANFLYRTISLGIEEEPFLTLDNLCTE